MWCDNTGCRGVSFQTTPHCALPKIRARGGYVTVNLEKKYQPQRPDILINSDFGIATSALDEKTAAGRGLVIFKDRYVVSFHRVTREKAAKMQRRNEPPRHEDTKRTDSG
jgi:hypothetical protein